VRRGVRDAALLLFGSLVDLIVTDEAAHALQRGHLGDGGGEGGLAVVDVTDGADVDVRLVPLKLGLSHC
jgi:hypothetical protein